MTPVRLDSAASWSRVKHSTTEPLRSLRMKCNHTHHKGVLIFLWPNLLPEPSNTVFYSPLLAETLTFQRKQMSFALLALSETGQTKCLDKEISRRWVASRKQYSYMNINDQGQPVRTTRLNIAVPLTFIGVLTIREVMG